MAAIRISLEVPTLKRRPHAFRHLSFALTLGLLSSRPLQAQNAEAPQEASRHFERGYQLAQEGNLEAAIVEFEQAYALKPHPLALYNLGQAYAASGRAVQAVATLRRYLTEAEPSDGHRAQANAMIEHQRQRVGELVLQVSPAGAEISVDGVAIGTAPLRNPIELTAGTHGVLVSLSGHEAQVERVLVIGKQRVTAAITLSPTPVRVLRLPPPAPANASQNTLLALRSERRQRIRIQRSAAIATAGLGIWSLALATIVYARNQRQYQDWNRRAQRFAARLNSEEAPTRGELDQLLAQENSLRNRDAWALGLGVLGGALSVTSAALWLSAPGAEPARLSFQVGPNNWLGYSSAF